MNEWTEAPALKAREYHSSSVLDGLLVRGGCGQHGAATTHTTGSWEALQPMTYPLWTTVWTTCRVSLCHRLLAVARRLTLQCHTQTQTCGPWWTAPAPTLVLCP